MYTMDLSCINSWFVLNDYSYWERLSHSYFDFSWMSVVGFFYSIEDIEQPKEIIYLVKMSNYYE